MELFRTCDCVGYAGVEPRIPTLSVTLHDPISRESGQVLAAVDTGFAGHVLLRKEEYERFASAELPAEYFTVYSTMAGSIALRKARVIIEIGKITLQAYVETPLYGPGRDIVGRRVLHSINLALMGEKENCCLLEKA